MAHEESRAGLPMPVKVTPYHHQMEAFAFACRLFGLSDQPENESRTENRHDEKEGDALCQKKQPVHRE